VNILAVNWIDLESPQAGGAEVHFFELFGRLVAGGHRVRLVCSGWRGCPGHATIQGVEVTRVGTRYSFALLGRGAVRRAYRAERPDIVVEDINKLPLYLTTVVPGPFCAIVPHLFGGTAFREASWPAASIVWVAERPIPTIYRRAGFHAISESTRDDLVRRGIPAGRIRVIHPGVDCEHFRPEPGLGRARPPMFLYMGRLKRYKGIDLALRALARARREEPGLSLSIAGSGDDRARLESLRGALGLEDAVTFHGYVSESQKLALLRQATANVFPSPKEGWGITNVEAAACGTPSLASDSPGLRDSVRDGQTGFLFPHGDVAALAQLMVRLAREPETVERLGCQGRAFAERLTWDAAAEATAAHLQDIIAARETADRRR